MSKLIKHLSKTLTKISYNYNSFQIYRRISLSSNLLKNSENNDNNNKQNDTKSEDKTSVEKTTEQIEIDENKLGPQ